MERNLDCYPIWHYLQNTTNVEITNSYCIGCFATVRRNWRSGILISRTLVRPFSCIAHSNNCHWHFSESTADDESKNL